MGMNIIGVQDVSNGQELVKKFDGNMEDFDSTRIQYSCLNSAPVEEVQVEETLENTTLDMIDQDIIAAEINDEEKDDSTAEDGQEAEAEDEDDQAGSSGVRLSLFVLGNSIAALAASGA